MRENLNDILNKFNIKSQIEEYGDGHINDTYCTESPKYILQRINTDIFKNPDELMENILNITEFLRKKIMSCGGNPNRETLTVVKTADNKAYYKVDDNRVFRVYKFIEDTITVMNNKEYLYNAGRGFGNFLNMLSDFPVEKLYETIKNFHNTPKRVKDLEKAIKQDAVGRASEVGEEIEFALKNAEYASKITDYLKTGDIPMRVTHNDTKMNNILFDRLSHKAVCVIDLDTVMPGSMLYDFGDALRIGASTAAEDETELDKVSFDVDSFRLFASGYIKETHDVLTEKEIELMPFSAKLLTYETGIRFLTDYINGDTYFKIHYPKHNIDRARNQFKLVKDIASKENELNSIIAEIMS